MSRFSRETREALAEEREMVREALEDFFPSDLDDAVEMLYAVTEVHDACHNALATFQGLMEAAERDDSEIGERARSALSATMYHEKLKHLALADLHNRMLEAAIALEEGRTP